jgi:hypothetical protein
LSDAVALVAGILLTLVGLLALLPFLIRILPARAAGLSIDRLLPALAAAEAALRPPPPAYEAQPAGTLAEDVDDLMAHLFGLRLTVGDLAEELQAAREILMVVTDDQDACDLPQTGRQSDDTPAWQTA